MEGKTHIGIGAVTYVAICSKLPGKFSLLGVFIVIIASVFPDIDHPKSMFNQYILPFKNGTTKRVLYVCVGLSVLWFDYLYTREPSLKALGVAFIAIALSSHRNGLTHSLLGLITFALIARYVSEKYSISNMEFYFIIGYGMHIICDMATKKGVPLFYPFSKKKFKFPITYVVGSKSGKIFEAFLILLALIYIVYKIPHIKMSLS